MQHLKYIRQQLAFRKNYRFKIKLFVNKVYLHQTLKKMNTTFVRTIFFCLLITFGALKTFAQSENQNLKRVWMLVEFQKFKKSEFLALNAQMDLTSLKIASAKMGCNNIGFKVKVNHNKIKFSKIFRTMIYCKSKMQIEQTFVKELLNYITYKIEKHKLIIKNARNQEMVFVAQDWD